MENNITTFKSGKEYTLANIFSGENRIIIPDLQRDYCWGGKARDKDKENHTELVSGFVQNLLESFKDWKNNKKNVTLGLIYGYEQPKHYIQLCDGQQRITTLFLLLGMLNRKTDTFQKNLISDNELNDDNEPYLQYAIRESTLYFLSDLVCKFFLKNDVSVSQITQQDWYFKEYVLDASIESMIAAIEKIEEKLDNFNEYQQFGDFILNNLEMIYYDMGDRNRGEETFVVINTTGEPLTATENLKPILLGNLKDDDLKKYSEQWEEREEWFWQNRGNNTISDYGMKEFVRWVRIIEKIEDKQNPTIKQLEEYFEVVKFLFETKETVFELDKKFLAPEKQDEGNALIALFKLLPVITFVKRFGTNILDAERNIIRTKHFFENLAKHTSASVENNLVNVAIEVIKDIPTPDIASIIQLKTVSKQILTDEERLKFDLFINPAYHRGELEDTFWKAEEHNIWKGEILPMIHWAKQDEIFDFDLFKKYDKIFNELFYDNHDYDDLDITRRALLTRELNDYPRIFTGNTNYSFCWEYYDWQRLIRDNETKFGEFLDELIDNGVDYRQQMIKNNPIDKDYDEFVKIPELLEYCEKKNIRWGGDEGWLLIKRTNATTYVSVKTYRLFLDLNKNIHIDDWTEFEFYNDGQDACAYTDNNAKNIAIDIYHCNNELYQLQVFRRDNVEVQNYLSDLAARFSLKWNGERYDSNQLGRDEIIDLLKQIMDYSK